MKCNLTGLWLELTIVRPRLQVPSRHSHVVLPRRLQHSKVAIVHSPSHLGWNTHCDRPSGNLLSAWDNTTYSNDTMLSDDRSIEDDRPTPIKHSSPTRQACTTALCATVTLLPITPSFSDEQWTTTLSWMLQSAPTRILP